MPVKQDIDLNPKALAYGHFESKRKKPVEGQCRSGMAKRKKAKVDPSDGDCHSASKESDNLYSKVLNGKKPHISLSAMTPDVEKGHNPLLLVFTDVPKDVTLPTLKEELSDCKGIIKLELLHSQKQDVLVYSKSYGDAQEMLDKAPYMVGNYQLQLVSWFDFCFEMMKKKVVKLTGLPPDIDESKIREFCRYESDIAFLNFVPEKSQALVFYESAYPMEMLLKRNKSEFLNSIVEIKRYRHSEFIQNIVFVFVNNLPQSVDASDVRDLFSTCGDVLKATFSEDKQTGRRRAVVHFNDKEEAERALELSGCEFLGEIIEVQSNCKAREVFSVYVGNLHRGTRPIDLCYIFQDCGIIVNVIVPNQQKIVHRGEPAIVQFAKHSSVTLALNKHKKSKIRGVRIFVTEEKPSLEDGSKTNISRSKMYQRVAQKRRNQSHNSDDYPKNHRTEF